MTYPTAVLSIYKKRNVLYKPSMLYSSSAVVGIIGLVVKHN